MAIDGVELAITITAVHPVPYDNTVLTQSLSMGNI
jgi:hypothetical protein